MVKENIKALINIVFTFSCFICAIILSIIGKQIWSYILFGSSIGSWFMYGLYITFDQIKKRG